jgi:hypothetical protein
MPTVYIAGVFSMPTACLAGVRLSSFLTQILKSKCPSMLTIQSHCVEDFSESA